MDGVAAKCDARSETAAIFQPAGNQAPPCFSGVPVLRERCLCALSPEWPVMLRAKFCVIGTGAGGGILAYRLAKAGADVLIINSGGIPAQSEFQNELSPEQK